MCVLRILFPFVDGRGLFTGRMVAGKTAKPRVEVPPPQTLSTRGSKVSSLGRAFSPREGQSVNLLLPEGSHSVNRCTGTRSSTLQGEPQDCQWREDSGHCDSETKHKPPPPPRGFSRYSEEPDLFVIYSGGFETAASHCGSQPGL